MYKQATELMLNFKDRILIKGEEDTGKSTLLTEIRISDSNSRYYNFKTLNSAGGFAPIFPDICYHLTHYKPAAADIPVASDNPAHYADAIRYNARTPLQGSLLPLTRLVWA